MAKKKRYTFNEVKSMFEKKYPYGYDRGSVIVKSKAWNDNYRIGGTWFKNLIDIVDRLNLEK